MFTICVPLCRYGQRVESDSTSAILAELGSSSGSAVLSNPSTICVAGFAMLTSLTIDARPGETVSLKLSVPGLGEQIDPVYVHISLPTCLPGTVETTTAQDNVVCTPCASGTFETGGSCIPCVKGMMCTRFGQSLETLLLEPGYWRSGTASMDVHTCRFKERSCPGNTTGPDPYCAPLYTGALCSTCAANSFLSWIGDGKCHECDQTTSHLPSVALFSTIGVIFGTVTCILKFLYRAGDRRLKASFIAKAERVYELAKFKMFTLFLTCQVRTR